MMMEYTRVKEWETTTHRWKAPLARKQEARERRLQREANKEPIEQQDAVVYVHDPLKGVVVPPHPENIFAVLRIKGRQIKVITNDRI